MHDEKHHVGPRLPRPLRLRDAAPVEEADEDGDLAAADSHA